MSKYVKFTYDCAGAEIARFDSLAELTAYRRKLLEQRLIGVDPKWRRVRELERPRRREGKFLHHRFGDRWSARVDADRLRTRCGVRFRKELAPLRRRCDSIIRIVDARCDLRIRFIDLSGDSLSRLGFVGNTSDPAPTTSKAVAYGTPEMAYEIMRLFTGSDIRSRKVFAMAGHEGGIVTFGKNLEDAFDVLMRARELLQPCDAGRQYARAPRQCPG